MTQPEIRTPPAERLSKPLPLPGPIAAFDVGGTDLKCGLVHPDGQITHRSAIPTPKDPKDPAGAVIDRVADLASTMSGAVGVGLVVPGIVDGGRGIGVVSANLGWRNAQFREPLATKVGLPVGFNHDVTAAATAEAVLGPAVGSGSAAVIIIGTGIAAGIFIDGIAHRGSGYAGELGHTVVDPQGPQCPCGARGCLEQFASAAAIARRYSEQSGNPAAGAREVLQAKTFGDEVAAQVWGEAVDALAAGMRQLAAIINPDIVVIGGGLQQAGDELFIPLRQAVEQTFTFYPVPKIFPATCGPDGGLLGSAIIGGRAVAP